MRLSCVDRTVAGERGGRGRRGRTSHAGHAVAGIDLITYHTDVKNVVVILGSLPAGDAMAGAGQHRHSHLDRNDARPRHDEPRQICDCRAIG